jgi:hypothetical protein
MQALFASVFVLSESSVKQEIRKGKSIRGKKKLGEGLRTDKLHFQIADPVNKMPTAPSRSPLLGKLCKKCLLLLTTFPEILLQKNVIF